MAKLDDSYVLYELTKPLGSAEPSVEALVKYIEAGGQLTRDGVLRWLVRALSKDRTLPFHLVCRKRKGNPGDPRKIESELALYHRICELLQLVVTEEVADAIQRKIYRSEKRVVKGPPKTIHVENYSGSVNLALRVGERMRHQDAFELAGYELGFKSKRAHDVFYAYRKALTVEE